MQGRASGPRRHGSPPGRTGGNSRCPGAFAGVAAPAGAAVGSPPRMAGSTSQTGHLASKAECHAGGSWLVSVAGQWASDGRLDGSSYGGGPGCEHAFSAILQPACIERRRSCDLVTRGHDACTKVRCHGACTQVPSCLPPVRPGRRAWQLERQMRVQMQQKRPALS